MKKMRILAMLAATVIAMGSLTACGNIDLDSMTIDEIVATAEAYGIDVTVEVVCDDDIVVVDEVDDMVEGGVEARPEVEDEAEAEVEEEPEVEAKETEAPKTKTETESAPTETPKTTQPAPTETPKTAQPAPTETPKTTQPAPTETPQPAHSHSWKEHTATKQTWVPNIVVVDDYETQYTESYTYICYCGFTTTDRNTIAQHVKNADLDSNCWGFTIQTNYSEQQVKVGSHEEDHGHYETSTYVDYYYCDCGATK